MDTEITELVALVMAECFGKTPYPLPVADSGASNFLIGNIKQEHPGATIFVCLT